MARKSFLFTALGVGSVAAVWAVRTAERMLTHGVVRAAVRIDTSGVPGPDLPVTPVPGDAVTTVTTGDPASNLPARTWVVDSSGDWEGNPGELVVLPHPGGTPERNAT
ncbi:MULTISPECIES: hypothetical protein [unclassified Arthrobacter]|uniref:hypothetical protein n=1 Tax=unclassified Arthrobacter TaxID=235627 RepID=UPI001D151D7C|nr:MULTISPECIES: hypothetical protein [unclassified Arthrobacter]MCC3290633.1 hypothetical protein [Arthrobacter sp. zg-Y1110]MCC3299855.1 hypothetical protein [Arthrobacter sp. zg-Y895]UWX84007.1 hypothetical protein N2K99_10935 [Arthrobacter sp. zg-Y1110]